MPVVSSIPDSNHTDDQINSLLGHGVQRGPENILYHCHALRKLLRDIAFKGFASVEWLQAIDINSVKLRNDARKFVFIAALGRFGVPVILPYRNLDARYKGQIKFVYSLRIL